jgi:hypothetical protein
VPAPRSDIPAGCQCWPAESGAVSRRFFSCVCISVSA